MSSRHVIAVLLAVVLAAVFVLPPGDARSPVRPPRIDGRIFLVTAPDTPIALADGSRVLAGIALLLAPQDPLGSTAVDAGQGVVLPPDRRAQERAAAVRAFVLAHVARWRLDELRSSQRRAAALDGLRGALRHRYRVEVRRVIVSDLVLP